MKKLINFLKKNMLFGLAIIIYLFVFILSPQKGFLALRISTVTLLNVILIIFSVFIFIGLFHVWIHEDLIIKHLGHESGLKGLALGALTGTSLNGPLFAIFPMLKSLLEKGAKLGVITVIFATYAIKVPLLPLEVSFFGWKFTIIHNLLMLLAAFIMAPLMEWMMEFKQPKLR
ncbi:MAG: hypothetical protein C4562_05195 [Actinobacteria bacterium]|nr:MAG: hypothetical protein C4562_05195 [Actinomycetota bacterium]